mgnify:FL=1
MRYQQALGREARLYVAVSESSKQLLAAALVSIDRTAGGLCTWNIARGPLFQWEVIRGNWGELNSSTDELLTAIIDDAKKDKCLSLYLSPLTKLTAPRFRLTPSKRHEQPEATVILNLTLTEEQLLAQMHQKGRYNIKLAQKHGVVVEQSTDIDAYYALAQSTGKRDGFTIKRKTEYHAFLKDLPGSFLLMAMHNNKPIAGLLGVIWHGVGIYYYGASDHTYRALMAPYALQWEAIKMCKAQGCTSYDLLGIAPPHAPKDDAWQGITDFKKKFGSAVIEYPTEREIILKPMTKKMLEMKRKFL